MMPSCPCFARRVKPSFVKYEISDFNDLATVHGVVFDLFVLGDPDRRSNLTARARDRTA
jgi:hypothetical protein